jgi:hypothetical protein
MNTSDRGTPGQPSKYIDRGDDWYDVDGNPNHISDDDGKRRTICTLPRTGPTVFSAEFVTSFLSVGHARSTSYGQYTTSSWIAGSNGFSVSHSDGWTISESRQGGSDE